MGNTYVISSLRDKRARIAGDFHQAEGVLKQRLGEVAIPNAVSRMVTQDCNPNMIPPIRPVSRACFSNMANYPRMMMSILRDAKRPMALDRIVDTIIEAKGFTVDRKIMRHIRDPVRATLMRLEQRGVARRVPDECES